MAAAVHIGLCDQSATVHPPFLPQLPMLQQTPASSIGFILTAAVATDAAGVSGVSVHYLLCAAAGMQGTAADAAAVN
jgi:hypothetical protein